MSFSSMCLVEIEGQPLPEDVAPLLISAFIDNSQRLPDMFSLRFRDPSHIVLPKSGAKVGSKVKLSVQVTGAQTAEVLLQGEITALEAEFDSGGTFTVIRGYDQTHRLHRGRKTKSFTQATASDVAKKVAQAAGLKLGTIDSTSTVFDLVTQYAQTDWELLEGLARDSNMDLTVKDGSFSFTKAPNASGAPAASNAEDPLVLELGHDLLRFRSVVTSAQQASQVEVRGWDIASKKPLVANAPTKTTSAQLPTVDPAKLASAFGSPTYVATEVPYRSQSEVDQASKSLAEALASTFAEFEGMARGNPKLRAGTAISVSGLGDPFDGKYTITSARHRFDPTTGYTTSLAVSGKSDRTMLGLASGGARGGRIPPGIAVALVTDIKDPQNAGRVKLKFPWLSDDYVSDWARTVQLGAGKDRGFQIIPEVGDEVLVAFEQGDFSRPNVLGGLFNGVDTMPAGPGNLVDSGAGKVNRRSIVSRNKHRIDLSDENGKDSVSISTADNKLFVKLDHTGTTITVHADGKVLIEGTQGITLDAKSSNIELTGNQIKFTAKAGVNLDGGSGTVDMKSNGPVSLKGMTVKVEGQTTADFKAGAMASISGAMVKIN